MGFGDLIKKVGSSINNLSNQQEIKDIKELADNASKTASNQIVSQGVSIEQFNLALTLGAGLAEKLAVNPDMIIAAIALSFCPYTNAKALIEASKVDMKNRDIIQKCIDTSGGRKPYANKESEICANAIAGSFIHPRSFFTYFANFSRNANVAQALRDTEIKIDEKMMIITLNELKSEVNSFYEQFKNLLKYAH